MTAISDSNFVFWEKPGCKGNRRQKWLLYQRGYSPQVRNLLTDAWTARELRAYFGDKPVSEWFNPSAPAIKSGSIRPDLLDEDMALLLMVNAPILVRRPLMRLGEYRQSGFEAGPVLEALSIKLKPGQDLQTCPKPDDSNPCGVSA